MSTQMQGQTKKIDQLAQFILASKKIALVCHVNPDADTLGSALALYIGIKNHTDKECRVTCCDAVPAMYAFLPESQSVIQSSKLPFQPDLVLCVDAASRGQLGDCVSLLESGAQTACIDHHDTNEGYCKLNVIDGQASATAVLILELLDALHIDLNTDMATCLYSGLTSDTGRFMYSLTNAQALQAGARCLELPINLEEIGFQLFRRKSYARIKLIGYAMNNMYLLDDGKIAVIELPSSIFEQTGALRSETYGIVNYGIETEGVHISIQAQQVEENVTKFSLRSRGNVDVSALAEGLGGGGHTNAAGVTVNLPMREAVNLVVTHAKKILK